MLEPILARARSGDGPVTVDEVDLVATARHVLLACLHGRVDPRTCEVQRKAAEYLLGEKAWGALTDDQFSLEVGRMNAEIARRNARATQ